MNSPLGTTLGARMSAYLTSADDFHKQRKRLKKRILKLRRELGIITKDTGDYRNKEKLTKVYFEDYDKDQQYGLLLLLTAERDVLYAFEIKSRLEISNENVSTYKNLMLSRMKRSLFTSKKLLNAIVNEKDDIRKLECYVYTALIQGLYSINKKQWQLALNAFSIARISLELFKTRIDLSEEETNDLQEESNQFNNTLINEIIETLIDPSLSLALSQEVKNQNYSTNLKTLSHRLCREKSLPYLQPAVEIVIERNPDIIALPSEEGELIKAIKWRDHEATIYNDEVAYKIMKLTDESNTIGQYSKDTNRYDILLTGWSELLDIHTVDVEKSKDDDELDRVQDRAILLTYINYNLLFSRIKRDLLLIEQLKQEIHSSDAIGELITKSKERVHLFNVIISTTQQIKDLPGVYNDETLSDSLENLEKFFEAKRNEILASTFAACLKFKQALKVYDHTEKLLPQETSTFFAIDEFPYNVTNNKEYREFRSDLTKKLHHTFMLAQFHEELANQATQGGAIISNMNKHPILFDFEFSALNWQKSPALSPVLSKPVLFDIGFNYINYGMDSSSSYNVSSSAPGTNKNSEDSSKKRGGLFGIFGRS